MSVVGPTPPSDFNPFKGKPTESQQYEEVMKILFGENVTSHSAGSYAQSLRNRCISKHELKEGLEKADVGMWLLYMLGDLETAPEEKASAEELRALEEEVKAIDIESLISIHPTLPLKKKDKIPFYEEALTQLDTLKGVLGGAPNYVGARPGLQTTKKFLFLPLDTVRAWISNAIRKGWVPKTLWQYIGKKIGLDSPLSQYEYVSLTIQSFYKLEQYKDELIEKILRGDNPNTFMHRISGLTCHTSLNKPGTLIYALNSTLELFKSSFEKAKEKGNLLEFFSKGFNVSAACFEARARALHEYFNEVHAGSDGSGGLSAYVSYSENNTWEEVLLDELAFLRSKLIRDGVLKEEDVLSADTFENYLVNDLEITQLKARPSEGEEPRALNEGELQGRIAYLRDVLCVLD